MTYEQLVDDVALASLDLGPCERAQIYAVDATRKRVDHLAVGEHVGGPGDQEPAWNGVCVHRLLELEQKPRHMRDLIDHGRPAETGDEPCGVVAGRLAGGPIIEDHKAHRMLAAGAG